MARRKLKDMVLCILEVVYSLSTDSFIMSLRRFVARRRNVRMIRSDNGSNLVGASAELSRAFQEMDHIKIGNFLKENGGEWMIWKRNPPLSSNMGGVWERQIRSARAILNSLLKTHGSSLSDESLETLLVEVEAVVKSCPLTKDVLSDVTSLAPLGPVNLLKMKSKVVMPPQITSSHQINTAENTGEESNICPMNFGTNGERRCYCGK